MGRCFCRASFSTWPGSSRRSAWVPTTSKGTPGQWCRTSGTHFSVPSAIVQRRMDGDSPLTFSNDAGLVTLKQTRKTSVWGYESGRRRS
jgi:hypothetical protein